MKSILYSTDFTESSINAFDYAVDYAIKSNAKLIVFHAYDPNESVSSMVQKIYDRVDIENFRNRKDKFPLFEKIVASKNVENLKIKYVIKEGEFIDSLDRYLKKKEDKIDLVILGSQTRQNHLMDLFFKPKSLKVLDDLRKPVIAVPDTASFDGSLNNFVFLVDYKEAEIEALEQVIERSQEFNSNLHVIHFDVAHGDDIVPNMDNFKASLESKNIENVVFKSIDSINIKESLREYCEQFDIDIVCLITHKRNAYQRLFSYSLTEDLLQHFDIPVMAIYSS